MSYILSLFVLTMTISTQAKARVRHVEVHNDQIVTVRTSLGIATIIQVPDRPNSVVVGDQESFKVEYLDEAITIKPLSPGARSNLYVYTDWRRFNIELISGHEALADYVVYLKTPKKKLETITSSGIKWSSFRSMLKNESLTLEVKRLGQATGGILLVEFILKAVKPEEIKPEWIWLTQGGVMKPIHKLFLSSLKLKPSVSVTGLIQLNEKDFLAKEPIRLELRRKKVSYLTILKPILWN